MCALLSDSTHGSLAYLCMHCWQAVENVGELLEQVLKVQAKIEGNLKKLEDLIRDSKDPVIKDTAKKTLNEPL